METLANCELGQDALGPTSKVLDKTRRSRSKAQSAQKPSSRRNRSYATPEKMRAAFLAGSGKTSTEIADALGSTTARKVRDLLRFYGIGLNRPFDRPKTIQIHCANSDFRLLEYRAEEMEYAPGDLVLAILRVVLGEPTIMRNLLDEGA